MNLKPFVASMFVLGLASSSAAVASTDTQSQLNAMKDKIAKMESIIQTNQGGGFQQPKWFDRISISGLANVDAFASNKQPADYTDGFSTSLNLNNANLFIDANVNEWTKVHIGLMYRDAPLRDRAELIAQANQNNFNSVLDEAYVRLGNFAKTPIYATLGKQYVDFGVYNRFPITKTFTQILTETRGTAATIGFVDTSGFHGSAYVLSGMQRAGSADDSTTRLRNFGLNLGVANTTDSFGYKFSAGYLRNMADVNYISALANVISNGIHGVDARYRKEVGAMSVDAAISSGAFDANAHYVSALQNFDVADLSIMDGNTQRGAKPSAWGLEAGYSFNVYNGRPSRLSVGYQGTKEAGGSVGLSLPKTRYVANYTFNVSKNADVGVEIYNDRDYSVSNGGVDRNATVGVLRLGVKFS
jgi:hypothetical protein